MKTVISFVCLIGVGLASARFEPEPLSDTEIFYINNVARTTWKAERYFKETDIKSVKGLLGVDIERNAKYNSFFMTPKPVMEEATDLPTNFDPRAKWPNCPSLNEIRDQSECGSCWAFGSVEAMTDRICIKYGKQVHISAEDVLDCCWTCGDGCKGGYPSAAWRYYVEEGIATGGQYHSNEVKTAPGCMPYSLPHCEHHISGGKYEPCPKGTMPTPKCTAKCIDGYNMTYHQDKHHGLKTHIVASNQLQQELFENGPVTAVFTVYSDFFSYKSGVYQHTTGQVLGGHAVKILGYGVENNVPYWLVANSWNEDWGDKGFFKILRGSNECGIESSLVAGEPKE